MSQKKDILMLLKSNKPMTQGAMAEAIYGDKNHTSNIYDALKKLVQEGSVTRTGSNPSYYSLPGELNERLPPQPQKAKKQIRDVSNDIINNEALEDAARLVQESDAYGPENDLITRCLMRFPANTDPDIVAMKIGLIDITNSTHLSQHKSKISMDELCHIIAVIPNIDVRIAAGDPAVVNEIARSNGKINLFSFASKYCCYHNHNLYGNDDYSIFDTVLRTYLPRYFKDVSGNQIDRWMRSFQYENYNNYITKKLDELGIDVDCRKRKFDHFVWFKNR